MVRGGHRHEGHSLPRFPIHNFVQVSYPCQWRHKHFTFSLSAHMHCHRHHFFCNTRKHCTHCSNFRSFIGWWLSKSYRNSFKHNAWSQLRSNHRIYYGVLWVTFIARRKWGPVVKRRQPKRSKVGANKFLSLVCKDPPPASEPIHSASPVWAKFKRHHSIHLGSAGSGFKYTVTGHTYVVSSRIVVSKYRSPYLLLPELNLMRSEQGS